MKSSRKTSFGKTKTYRPSDSSSNEQVVVVPGYSETITHSKKLVDALVGKGFDALTFNQPRRRGDKSLDPIQRQGAIILELFDSLDKRKPVHAVAHSLGAAAVLKAAIEAPERFKSLTLLQPAGLTEDQSFPEQLGRVGEKVVKNQVGALKAQNPDKQPKAGYAAAADTEPALKYSARVGRAQAAGAGVLGKQGKLAYDEARAAGTYDMADDIAKVNDLGIPVNIVTAHSDEMYDQDKVDAGYQAIASDVASYSTIADKNARHDTFWMQPERTAKVVEQLIHQR